MRTTARVDRSGSVTFVPALAAAARNARMALSIADFGYVLESGRIVLANNAQNLMEDEDVKEFYLGVKSEVSEKGYQRWRRKKRWR